MGGFSMGGARQPAARNIAKTAFISSLRICDWGDRSAEAAENVRLVYLVEAGAQGCPDEGAVRRSVAARLGYDPFVETGGRTVRATLGERGRWLRASIEITDENGELLGQNQLT